MEGDRDRAGPSSKRQREDDQGNEPKRAKDSSRAPGGRMGGRSDGSQSIVHTRPHDKEKSFKGPNRERVQLEANYFRLIKTPTWTIYKYDVKFEPECLMARLRQALVMKHKDAIGGFLFDGTQLFLTRQLEVDNKGVIEFTSKARSEEVYTLKVQFTKVVEMTENESLQILNLIWRRGQNGLKLELVGRNYYDAKSKISLDQFKIELWPGFTTSIRKHEVDILLQCDVAHKVMRRDTVYDLMQETHRADRGNFQNNFKQKALGLTVLTSYNNKTYRIDDIDFDKSPMTTFDKKGEPVTIAAYYVTRYGLEIKDKNQPLLITKPKEKNLRGGAEKPTWLVPELCRITGLSERQRTDISMKMAMKPYSQMVPRTRKQRLLDYNNRIRRTEESMNVFREWNLDLDAHLVRIEGHRLKSETLTFGNREHGVQNASWDRECGRGLKLFHVPCRLNRWYIVFPRQIEREANRFVNRAIELAQAMGFEVNKPRSEMVGNDRELAGAVDKLASTNPQLMCFIVTSNKNSNADIYSAIKKRCYSRLQSGAPWSTKIPLGGVMTVGFDVSKDSQNKNMSYGCLVATMDLKQSPDFYATVNTYSSSETLSNEFSISVKKTIRAYRDKYQSLPRKIIIYRGGVGDGDIQYVKDIEVANLEQNLKGIYAEEEQPIEMAFIIVTKKINTRIFEGDRNPAPGTVVDDVITLAERYEFFLVSQFSNQGSVSPTNYNIIYDTTGLSVDKLQIWTYKHCHLYYNWCGTTRVPAVLQYATKLAFLVSNYMHRVPHNQLENSLFFL